MTPVLRFWFRRDLIHNLRRKTGECIALKSDVNRLLGETSALTLERDRLHLEVNRLRELNGDLCNEVRLLREQHATKAELDHATGQLEIARTMLAEKGVTWYPAPIQRVEIKGTRPS